MATTVTSKGQVTIPKHVRDSLGIEPGSQVTIELSGAGEAVLRKVRPLEQRPDRFDRALGTADLRLGCTVDEYMAMIRGYEEDDPGLSE
jgi:antitoxin PrlF